MKTRNKYRDALQVLIAIVLLSAALLKARQLTTEPVLGIGPLESLWFQIGVVEMELLFALWLLATLTFYFLESGGEGADSVGGSADGECFWTWIVSIAFFFVFGCASLWKVVRGEENCGCFGPLTVNPWYTTLLDWILVAALIWFRPRGLFGEYRIDPFRPVRVAGVVAIWALVGGPVGYAVARFHPTTLSDAGSVVGEGNLVILEPERWIGKRLPLLNYIDIGDRLKDGEWIVVFFRSGCSECEALLRDYKRRVSAEAFMSRIALIKIPPYSDSDKVSDLSRPTFVSGRLSDAREWFVKTPLQLKLTDGVVTWEREQENRGSVTVDHWEASESGTVKSDPP